MAYLCDVLEGWSMEAKDAIASNSRDEAASGQADGGNLPIKSDTSEQANKDTTLFGIVGNRSVKKSGESGINDPDSSKKLDGDIVSKGWQTHLEKTKYVMQEADEVEGDVVEGKLKITAPSDSKLSEVVYKLLQLTEGKLIFCENHPYISHDIHERVYLAANEDQLLDWVRSQMPLTERISVRKSILKEAVEIIRPELQKGPAEQVFNSHPGLVNCRNGVVCIDEGTPYLIENTEELFFNYVVDADFVEADDLDTPALDYFIDTSLGGDPDKEAQLLEFLGYALSDVKGGKVILFLMGVSNTGKSLMCQFLQHLLAVGNVTNVPLHQFSTQYIGQLLCSAKLNISAEVEASPLKATSMLKALTGGDRITADAKYIAAKTMSPNVKLICAANSLPELQTGDPTDSIFNRIEVLPFTIPIEKKDPCLLERLLEERSAIFTKAMWALARIVENGLVFTRSADARKVLMKYRQEANSFLAFEHDCLCYSTESSVGSGELKSAYAAYCKENAMEALKTGEVRKYLLSRPYVEAGRIRDGERQYRGFIGVGFKNEDKE